MIVEIGHFALVLALCVSLVQGTLPLIGAARGDLAWMDTARPSAVVQFGLVSLAFLTLFHAFIYSDFSVALVANHSHSLQPTIYKISAAWGNHEGSMVLWVFILALFGAAIAIFGNNLPASLRSRVLAVQGLIGFGFLLFIIATSNPFLRLDPPALEGANLNPLLQDPGLAFHPPFLYLGYVGFSTAFSFAVAALIEGRVDPAWARWVRPWTLAAWCALTVGIAMGSWWAYYELGWGGWWFWDPVENASFMPWIVGTALLHTAIVVEKRDSMKTWTILLSILTFSLSLIGTFLVRSGVLTSVHAFATDPGRGLFILMLLVVAIGGSLTLYAWRAPMLKGGGLFAPISREGALVLNNLLLTTAFATVFLGTLYPLFLDVLGGSKVSVGPPYFNATFLPLTTPVAVAMVVGPMLAWKRGDLAGALQRLWLAFVAVGVTVAGTIIVMGDKSILAALAMGLAAWVAVGVVVELAERLRLFRAPVGEVWRRARQLPRASYGMSIAHFGVAVFIAGVTASSAWRVETIVTARPGDTLTLADYDFRFLGVRGGDGPNYSYDRGFFEVSRQGKPVALMTPEKRAYIVQSQPTTEAAIHTTFFSDLYAVLGDADGSGSWTVRLYYNPLVPWIWIGCVIMAAGGMVSLSDRRLRIGVPVRRRREPMAAAEATA